MHPITPISILLLPALAAAATAAGPVIEHRIEPGDTLIGLRGRVLAPDADWRRVQRLNRIADPRRLQPGGVLRIPAELALQRQPEVAELLYVHGSVTLLRAGVGAPSPSNPGSPGNPGTPTALAGGMAIRAGDVLQSAAQSSAVLRFADGSRVLLRPDSVLRVERSSTRTTTRGRQLDTRLRLESGAADTEVPPPTPAAGATTTPSRAGAKPPPPRLQMQTPVVNLAVRGTRFRTAAEAGRARLEVLEGTVAAGRLAVADGFGVVVVPVAANAAGGPPGAPQPLLAAPRLDGVPALVERVPLDLMWPAQAGASAYRAQVFETGTPDRLLLEGLFTQARAAWVEDLPDGRYELRVRSADAAGIEGRDGTAPFVLKARPEPPFVVEPRAGTESTDSSLRARWTLNTQAARYHLQVATDEAFAVLLADERALEGSQARIELPLGRVFWRVRSVRTKDGREDPGPWGPVQTYTRLPEPPPPPPPSAPQSLPAQPEAEGLRVAWVPSPLPGVRYEVQAARDAAFATVLASQTTAEPSWLLPSPEPGMVYVRVRSIGADGRAGPWGTPQSIEVPRQWPWWLWLLPLVLLL